MMRKILNEMKSHLCGIVGNFCIVGCSNGSFIKRTLLEVESVDGLYTK